MKGKFSKYLRSKKELIRKLIARLREKYPYVSVLGTDVSGQTITVDKTSTILTPSGITESGFVIKVFNGAVYSEYSTNEIEENKLDCIVAAVDKLVAFRSSIPNVNVGRMEEKAQTGKFVRKNIGLTYTPDQLIKILDSYVRETMELSPLIVNVRASIENFEVSKMFLSDKKDLEQHYTWTNPRAFVLTRRGDVTRYAYDGFGINSMEKALSQLKDSMSATAKLAIELLDATIPTPGYYDVITDPSISGLIAHEAFGHGVEMDMFVRDRAQAKEHLNKQVASPLISMRDGAASTLSVASYYFDDDGVLAQNTKIIDRGILVGGLSDALSALELGVVPTGNGRRESYKRKAYTRMTNTFFEKGKDRLEDMIKSINYGYLIAVTNNGMEDPKNWGIQCTALYGREIKNGEFTGKLVSPVIMSGYVIDLLKSISAVSKDLVVTGSGQCGKGYKEWVRVSDGGPYLKARVKIG
ncbi:MAG: TldD/PmbA family protein [Acholeplasmataceae bacterium]|nr:TldD/PmbA family protein [Acholeplasmataceae bacterium]